MNEALVVLLHLLLSIISVVSIKLNTANVYILCYFVLVLTLSVTGLIRFGHPQCTKLLISLHSRLQELSATLALPLTVSQQLQTDNKLWLGLLGLSSVIVLILQKPRINDVFCVLLCIVSLVLWHANGWISGLCITTLGHLVCFERITTNYDIPRNVLDSFGTVFVCFFVANAAR